MDLMELRRALLVNGVSNPKIPQIVLTYTLAEDFVNTASTTLASLESSEINSFCDSCFGIRGNFEVGKFKILHVDVKSDATPAIDRSYLTHFWFDNYYYFPAGSQIYAMSQGVIVPKDTTNLTSNSPLYTLRPELVSQANKSWKVNIMARTNAAIVPFTIWKAGTYTMTLSYLGEANYD